MGCVPKGQGWIVAVFSLPLFVVAGADNHRNISNKTFDFKSNYNFTPFSSLISKELCVGLVFCLHSFKIIFFWARLFL